MSADDPSVIQLITSWPGMSHTSNEKVPSRICYGPNGQIIWGNMIKPTEKGEVQALMKLRLDDRFKKSRQLQLLIAFLTSGIDGINLDDLEAGDGGDDESPGGSSKDPVDVAADYLTEVRKWVWTELEKQHGEGLFSTLTKELVVTVPAVWSERAKDQTLKAVTKSGWETTKVSLVTEPEAAAIYTLKWMTTGANKEHVHVGDTFVL
jgi:molecular chaperone DnaK (HSP70)